LSINLFECFLGIVTRRYGDLEEFEVFGINVTEKMGILLLDQFFEDADVVGLRNLDSEPLLPVT